MDEIKTRSALNVVAEVAVFLVASQSIPCPLLTPDLLHHPNGRCSGTSWFFSRCTKQQDRQRHAYLSVSLDISPHSNDPFCETAQGHDPSLPPPTATPPDKSATAIQISSLDGLRLQAVSSYRPSKEEGGLSFDPQSLNGPPS